MANDKVRRFHKIEKTTADFIDEENKTGIFKGAVVDRAVEFYRKYREIPEKELNFELSRIIKV